MSVYELKNGDVWATDSTITGRVIDFLGERVLNLKIDSDEVVSVILDEEDIVHTLELLGEALEVLHAQ